MKTAVLTSGGVDSSVALRLLHESRGSRDLVAFYLKIWLEDDLASLGSCPWEEDLGYVREICDEIGVPLEVVPLQREYWDRVVSYTVAELEAGRTPSPDIFCNQRIKFGAFFDHLGPEFGSVASGHYARKDEVTVEGETRLRLLKGVDPVKDQTYFLSHLTRDQLHRVSFPVGGLPKSEVRDLAERYRLPNRHRRDSQGICFLGKIRFPEFVEYHLGERRGPIIEKESGRRLGEHRGYWFHTVGQRKGLGLSGGPWFVVEKDIADNAIFVTHQEHLVDNRRREFVVVDLHWIDGAPDRRDLEVKLRHGARVHASRIEPVGEQTAADPSSTGGLLTHASQARVVLEEEDAGIAAGQFAIFYDGDHCLGGGTIR